MRRLISPIVVTIACVTAGATSTTASLDPIDADVATRSTLAGTAPTVRALPDALNPTPDDAKVTITYRLMVDSTATLRVDNRIGDLVWGPITIPGPQPPGRYTVDWNVRDNDGLVPPDDRYHVVLDTTDTVGGDAGSDTDSILLDSVGPRVGSAIADTDTLYPVKDGYLDVTRISVRGVGDSAVHRAVEIVDAEQHVVRSLRFGTYTEVRWNGRRPNGTLVPEGRYRYYALVSDAVGNISKSTPRALRVSHQRLRTRSFSKAISARATLRANASGHCGDLYSPSHHKWKGSIGYYGWAHCRAAGHRGTAVGVHAIRVPRAAEYVNVKVGAYGGAAFKRAPAYAELELLSGPRGYRGTGETYPLNPDVRYHAGRKQSAEQVIDPADLLLAWSVSSRAGGFYDIKYFKIALVYKVLV